MVLLPWLLLLLWRHRAVVAAAPSRAIAPHLLQHLRLRRNRARDWLGPVPVSTAMVLLATLLLMGPSWRQQEAASGQDQAVTVLLLDVSQSMTTADVAPSRLERAKQKISDLLALQPDRAAALVVYAGSAHEVLPLTADHALIRGYLESIVPQVMPLEGKRPGLALPLVDRILQGRGDPASVLLLTDGPGDDSSAVLADYFPDRGHQLLVLGMLPAAGEGSASEGRALGSLAAAAGGHYAGVTTGDTDLRWLQRHMISHRLPDPDRAQFWQDSGYPLLFPVMLLFLACFRKGWGVGIAGCVLPLLLAGVPLPGSAQDAAPGTGSCSALVHRVSWLADLWLTRDQQGRMLLWRGCYREAGARFKDPLWQGVALYYAGDYLPAADRFAASDTDTMLFNQGNALALGSDYRGALERYERLLARNPSHPGAIANRQRVLALLDAIRLMGEGQQDEPGANRQSMTPELMPETADAGVPESAPGAAGQLVAEDILDDSAMIARWLRAVQHDPTEFLAAKFRAQLRARDATGSGEP